MFDFELLNIYCHPLIRYEETPSGLKPYRQKDGALLAIEYRLADEELVREGVAQVMEKVFAKGEGLQVQPPFGDFNVLLGAAIGAAIWGL
uniref:Uncharacterized protein n=1 Tax=Tanacetum cinerariifolium TaxID=118510 RepID=A0A6L2LMU5_TANCI|nr:hypothetical protein [Tanacetum cinerariifolium]